MPTILIVDDEVNVLKLYKHDFEEVGYRTFLASTAAEAMHCVREQSPDVVILDIKLGGESGLECLRQIKIHDTSTPVILNSGYSTYRDDFSSWLADAYQVKSGDTSELILCVAELLASKPVS